MTLAHDLDGHKTFAGAGKYLHGGRHFVVAVILKQVGNDKAFPSNFSGRMKSVLNPTSAFPEVPASKS
jgi:hypothetical protein